MLDEIINYVQSLQRQVEVGRKSIVRILWNSTEIFREADRQCEFSFFLQFLSMKLASVNTSMDFNNMDALMSNKDVSFSSKYQFFLLL